MSKRFTPEERAKIIEAFEKDGTVPEGYYIKKNKNDVYNIRHVKVKKPPQEKDTEFTPPEPEDKPKKEPKPNSL